MLPALAACDVGERATVGFARVQAVGGGVGDGLGDGVGDGAVVTVIGKVSVATTPCLSTVTLAV